MNNPVLVVDIKSSGRLRLVRRIHERGFSMTLLERDRKTKKFKTKKHIEWGTK